MQFLSQKSAARQISSVLQSSPVQPYQGSCLIDYNDCVDSVCIHKNNKALSHFLFSLSDFSHLSDGSDGIALCCHGGELQTVIFQVLEL